MFAICKLKFLKDPHEHRKITKTTPDTIDSINEIVEILLYFFGTYSISRRYGKKINTLKRNRNATLFQWQTYGVLFKVIDGDNEL